MTFSAILAILAFYLWVVGGIGWINWYEEMEGTEFNLPGKALVFALWPFMGFVAGVTQGWAEAAEILTILKEKVRGK